MGSKDRFLIGNLAGEVFFNGDFDEEVERNIAEAESRKKELESGIFHVKRSSAELPGRKSLLDGHVVEEGVGENEVWIDILSKNGLLFKSFAGDKRQSDEEILNNFKASVPDMIKGEERVIQGLKKEVSAFLERYNKTLEFLKSRETKRK